jgi:hypothetical protein
VFCAPSRSILHSVRKWYLVCVSKTAGKPVRWSACIRTRHVALYRVQSSLASRDIMTCQKTNTLCHHHHHHHGECTSKMTAEQFSLSYLYLLTLFTFTLFTHPVALISTFLSLSLSLRFIAFVLTQYSFGFYPPLTFTSFPLFSHTPLATVLSAVPSFLYSYLGNNKRYLQFRFCRYPSNGATIQPPIFPRGWQKLAIIDV